MCVWRGAMQEHAAPNMCVGDGVGLAAWLVWRQHCMPPNSIKTRQNRWCDCAASCLEPYRRTGPPTTPYCCTGMLGNEAAHDAMMYSMHGILRSQVHTYGDMYKHTLSAPHMHRAAAANAGLPLAQGPGSAQYLGYNPPWTLPWYKTNEVIIPVAE